MAQGLTELTPLYARGDYLGGRFVAVGADLADGVIERVSPRDYDDLVGRYPYRELAIDEAVAAARTAFPGWAVRPLAERTALMSELKRAISARSADFALLLAREVGKPLWEAETEVQAALSKIDITLADGLALVASREVGSPAQRYAFRPHGVAAVLGPFNFPLHLVHGHVVPALVTGNTVVIKPSELAPGVGQLYAECFDAAGFPPGVLNMVQGEGKSGARLAAHPEVDVVMLTGSYAVGQSIKRATLDQPHKLLALELGGHNPAIVLGDADVDKAVHDVLWGAFVTAGQRCSGTAVALVERSVWQAFRQRLTQKLAGLRVADPLSERVFMGPLISAAARERYLSAVSAAEQDGVLREATGNLARDLPRGAYVQPTVHVVSAPTGRAYETDELFGPDLALECVDDLSHAIARANHSPYRLSASVFGASESAFEHAFTALRYGCINWNAPTCGASSRLPFGGVGKSGNHRPAALFSTLYATYPVASIRGPHTLDSSKLSPGFDW